MNACILSVGTEILMGSILNTNTKYLSEKLNEYGVSVLYHCSVGDNPKRLKTSVAYYLDKVDMIITTGGLGPTQDDLTKEIVCETLGCELVRDESIYQNIKGFFDSIGRPMTENNAKQALVPTCGRALENDMGTAPGIYIEKEGKHVFLLPGPPREMAHLFETHVGPMIAKSKNQVIHSKFIKLFGMGESSIEDKLLPLIEKQSNPTIATYAKGGEIEIRVTASAESLESAEGLLKPVVDQICDLFDSYVFSTEGQTLAGAVGRSLIDKGLTISVAESCTGGLLAGALTDVAGISKSLKSGYVTYSNEAKMTLLGVSEKTLNNYGAVSQETALEMVAGLRRKSGSDISISITGIAGPSGGSDNKAVGLVYIGIGVEDDFEVHQFNFHGNRDRVRAYSVLNALDLIRKKL